jgi:argininosuccinate synthase
MGALLVFDEVQTGVGRTGRFLAAEHFGVRADVTVLSKALGGGLPLAAVLLTAEAAAALAPGMHGTTFGGNPVAAAAGLWVVGKIANHSFLSRVERRGRRLRQGLDRLVREHPASLVEARGLGLLAAVELGAEAGFDAPAFLAAAREHGLLLVRGGERSVRFLPPLTVTDAEIDEAIERASRALDGARGEEMKKIVLAYSGGLDTSIIVHWLKEKYGCEVVCYCCDVGQGGGELDGLAARARRLGASDVVVEDLRETFAKDYAFPTLRAGAVYEGKYLLGTSIARPLIAARQVACARATGADALAHGCTGKGNDQVRFELTYMALAPELPVIAPWREPDWGIVSREDALDYAAKHGLDVPMKKSDLFSRDGNLWHLSHEGGPLEDVGAPAPESMYRLTASPADRPAQPESIVLGFERGWPVSLDGQKLSPASLVEALNARAGRHGVGRADVVESRVVGMKSRGVYETPRRHRAVRGARGPVPPHADARGAAHARRAGAALRRPGVRGPVVRAAAQGARRVPRGRARAGDRHGHGRALPGLRACGRAHEPERALHGAGRLLRHDRLRAAPRRGLHQDLRSADGDRARGRARRKGGDERWLRPS